MNSEKIEEKVAKEVSEGLIDLVNGRPTLDILYVSSSSSRLDVFRGRGAIERAAGLYKNIATINCDYVTPKSVQKMSTDDVLKYNVIYMDNIDDYHTFRVIGEAQQKVMEDVASGWVEKAKSMEEKEQIEYLEEVIKLRQRKARFVYALDEFVWEGVVGRVRDVNEVMRVEAFLSLADTIVVPTGEMKEALHAFGFVDENNGPDIVVITSTLDQHFFPLFKSFAKRVEVGQYNKPIEKPRVLIKGVEIPENIQEFISKNRKKMDITICSVGWVSPHVTGLLESGKVKHIHHWANPAVNEHNMKDTLAIERDGGYDFVIHCYSDDMNAKMYEITSGDEDIMATIASGAVPIVGIEHVGYPSASAHIGTKTPLQFGKDTTARQIKEMIDSASYPEKWNELFGQSRALVESRVGASGFVLSRYFNVFVGKEQSKLIAEAVSKAAEVNEEKTTDENTVE